MIAIYTTDGTELQLEGGSVFTISWISTAFNDGDEFLGSYSYPVALSYCPVNNKALGMANRLENRSARQDITVLVRIFGIHWKRCTLSFTIDTDSYSAYLKIDNGIFANILKNKLITDIYVNKDSNGTFVSFLSKQITTSSGATSNYLNTSVYDTTGKYPVYFFPVMNENLFGSFSGDAQQYTTQVFPGGLTTGTTVNPWSSGIGFVSDIADEPDRSSFYTPFFNLLYIVKDVLNFLGYAPGGDFFTDPLIMDKVIFNTGFMNSLELFADTGMVLQPAKHLPAISLSDFFKFLRTEFKLAIYFDPDLAICNMNIVRNTLKSRQRTDISGAVSPKYSIKSDLPDGYEIEQAIDDADDLYKTSTYDKSLYIGSTEAPTSISGYIGTVFTQYKPNPFNIAVFYRLPRVQQVGNGYTTVVAGSDSYNDPSIDFYNKNSFAFRLLTYRGMHNDNHGHPYPYASGDDIAANDTGSNTISDYPLSLWLTAGPKSILSVYSLDWYNFFLRTELVELDAFLPMRLLQQITPLGLLEFRTPSQAIIPAMLNDMTFEASQNEKLLESKMRVYPIYSQKDIDAPAISTFVPSQVINPGGTYVSMNIVNDLANSTYYYLKGVKVWLNIKIIMTLSFWQDEAGTIPKYVNDLVVYIHYISQNVGSATTTGHQATSTATGTTYVTGFTDAQSAGSVITDYTYNLAIDPAIVGYADYKVIGDIFGNYVPPPNG